jgi:hypothetical protein
MGRALAKPIIFRADLMGFASLYPSYAPSRSIACKSITDELSRSTSQCREICGITRTTLPSLPVIGEEAHFICPCAELVAFKDRIPNKSTDPDEVSIAHVATRIVGAYRPNHSIEGWPYPDLEGLGVTNVNAHRARGDTSLTISGHRRRSRSMQWAGVKQRSAKGDTGEEGSSCGPVQRPPPQIAG